MSFVIKRLTDTDPTLSSKLKQFCYDLNGCFQQVHCELGPFLNEYMYQEALNILFEERGIAFTKEYYFSVDFHGRKLQHKHYVDFLCKDSVLIECKAIDALGNEQRQQLWNYMRLTKIPIGILINFAPIHDQCEHYYLDVSSNTMYTF